VSEIRSFFVVGTVIEINVSDHQVEAYCDRSEKDNTESFNQGPLRPKPTWNRRKSKIGMPRSIANHLPLKS